MKVGEVALSISLLLFGTASRAAGPNPWRELTPATRAALERVLRPDPLYHSSAMKNGGFRAWYREHYCPALRDSDPACPTAGAADPAGLFPEYRFNVMTLEERVSTACVMARIAAEGPLPPGMGAVAYPGGTGVLAFRTPESEDSGIRSTLASRGYGNWHGAGFGKAWGVRSPNVGPYLHWYRAADGTINVHIDLNNPGDYDSGSADHRGDVIAFAGVIGRSLRHRSLDLDDREATHTPQAMVAASMPDACGLGGNDLLTLAARAPDFAADAMRALGRSRCPP